MPPLRKERNSSMSEAAPLTRPYGVRISALSFRRGRTLAGPLKDGSLQGREGHTSGWLLSAFGRFAFSPSPTKFKKEWVGEALGPPTRDVQHRKSPPLIRLACARHLLPRREKAFGRLIAAPTAGNGPEALARPSQARGRNRNSRNSGTVRAQWPGVKRWKPLRFCAPEILQNPSRMRPS